MWWQDQLVILKSGQPVSYLLALALVPAVDAVFGFSRALAGRLRMQGQEDMILLSFVILEARKAGATDCIVKPFVPDQVLARASQILGLPG